MSSIAQAFGFRTFRTIYDDPSNAELRVLRPDPNQLAPGDEVTIPDHEEREERAATEKRHDFVVKVKPAEIRLRLDVDQSVDYELVVEGKLLRTGTTDGSSPIIHEIPRDARVGSIALWPTGADKADATHVIALDIGGLIPVELMPGVKGRLLNLGHYDGAVDNEESAEVTEAVRIFQRAIGAEDTGTIDGKLHQELRAHHDLA